MPGRERRQSAGGAESAPPAATRFRGVASPSSWGPTFTSLSERDYAWFFAGNLAFFMGMQMQHLLRGFLAFQMTGTAAALGYIAVSIAIPMLLFAPIGGVVADRVDKRRLLILTQSAAAAMSLVLAVLILTDLIVFWHLLMGSAVTGTAFAFNMPARQALVPQLVPQHKLMNAVTLQMGGMNMTRVVAPAAAGLLIGPMGVGGVYVVTFLLFLIAAGSELRLPEHGMVSQPRRGAFLQEFMEGVSYIRQHGMLKILLALGLIFPLFAFPLQQMLPVFADDVFEKGSGGLGVLSASTGLGGVMGALLAARFDRQAHKGRLMLLGGLWMGGLFVAFTQMPYFAPAIIFLALGNVGGMIVQTTNNSVIQAGLPAEMRGRVMSVVVMSFGLMALGVLPVSLAADVVGARTAVAGSSLLLIATVLGFFLFSKRLRSLRVEPLSRAELSPVRAAQLVAEGTLSEEEAARRTRGVGDERRPARAAADQSVAPLAPAPTASGAETVSGPRAQREGTALPTSPPREAAADAGRDAGAGREASSTRPIRQLWRGSVRPLVLTAVLGVGMVLGFAASGSGEILRAWRSRIGAWFNLGR